jgi:hypothetical protein
VVKSPTLFGGMMQKFIVSATYIKMFQIQAESEQKAYDIASLRLELNRKARPEPADFQFCNWHVKEVI